MKYSPSFIARPCRRQIIPFNFDRSGLPPLVQTLEKENKLFMEQSSAYHSLLFATEVQAETKN